MKDRELVELAAKAMGYDGLGSFDECEGCLTDHTVFIFDPLNDDADAFRLVVNLHLWVDCDPECVNVIAFKNNRPGAGARIGAIEEYGADPAAATRRAIARVAAEIGRRAEFSQLAETLKTEPRTD